MKKTLQTWYARTQRVFRSSVLLGMAVLTAAVVTTVPERSAAAIQSKSVWNGVYTQEQAARGGSTFASSCARCHSAEPNGGEEGRSLTGKHFWDSFRESTVDHLLDYVSRNMPNGAGGSLSANTYVDLVAFILSRNDLPAGPAELTKESAAGVQIIAKTGPGELPGGTLVRVVGCLAKKEGGGWILNSATVPERPNAATDPNDSVRPLGARTFSLMFVFTPLDPYVGHRLRVRGLLMGEGGRDGINVTQTESIGDSCK
jgi:mono/diheme cytochrome c family protein